MNPALQDRPRCQHYTFAHLALRDAFFAGPEHLVRVLRSDQDAKGLQWLWQHVGEFCTESGQPVEPGPAHLRIHSAHLGGGDCIVVEMPQPLFTTEAHFVALLIDLEGESAFLNRYLTLERGDGFDGSPRTVFCEWRSDGAHINFGDGPEVTVDAFVAAIKRLIRRA